MIVALVIAGVVELVAITVLLLLAAAPMGWQDENGFHYGIEPGTDPRVSFDRFGMYGEGDLW